MTYYAGDPEASIVFPITDTTGGTLAFTANITATTAAGLTAQLVGQWQGAAVTTNGVSTRNLAVPLDTLVAGLWSLRVAVADVEDFFLGNVVLE